MNFVPDKSRCGDLILLPIILIMALLAGCSDHPPSGQRAVSGTSEQKTPVQGCRGCHPLTLDKGHQIPCAACHRGNEKGSDQETAHVGLVPGPAHPDQMLHFCGTCHAAQVTQAAATLHFTLANEINLVRQAFGGKQALPSLTAIPVHDVPQTALQLSEDLLRRRCLRCHLYSPGDAYPATRHGTGCAACHLALVDGSLEDHRFLARPGDQQCLSCHYGNRVGADYYGRFEQDVNWDFQTPFSATAQEEPPPYGVGYHLLSPDLHQQAGMSCIDCHGGQELMAGGRTLSCLTCHGQVLAKESPVTLTETDGRRQLTLASTGKHLDVPVMKDPAHARYGKGVACQVCHGQWSFTDHGNHLLRLDIPDYEPWQAMTRQGSSEVERKLGEALSRSASDEEPTMTDGITGTTHPGIWLQAYELRRWEEINTCLDRQGVLQVCRPILDLHLSYVNQDGAVVFDGVAPAAGTPRLSPYTPHTTGRAGAFYRQRLSRPPWR